VVYDGTPIDFRSDFLETVARVPQPFPIKISLAEAGSNITSWRVAMNIAERLDAADDDFFYFLENDYLHVDNWIDKFFELIASGIYFDYLSLYDHRDKYFYPMYSDLSSKIFATNTHHWRTTPSTCGSFLVRRSIFLQDFDYWFRDIQDHVQFQELYSKKCRTLLSPIPGLSTHCMEGYLSPAVDWNSIAAKSKRRLPL
jgi:hypothetical protein